jgi:hypothetical protein
MTTEVDVCNLALGSLGLEPITALTDLTQRARTCNLFYSIVRDNYLTEHDWSFLLKVIELTEIDPLPDGYNDAQYGYLYPADCLKARKIRTEDYGLEYPFIIRDYVIAGPADSKMILTNLGEAFLEYTVGLTDPDLFSSPFLMALSKKLAFEISWPLTKNSKIQKQAYDQFLIADNNAKQKDSSEQLPESRSLTWDQARQGGYLDSYRGMRDLYY